ncbi:MAG: HRDC domain-containing protein [Desulfobacterales bacterium]|nr:HRDC domain-containing protein [Desulfobacterales bacterium]
MKNPIPNKYPLVETLSGLEKIATIFAQEEALAIDLEADSMYHFQEKVCLLQMASHKTCTLIDPLQVGDLSSLHTLFLNPAIKKIFHGADYDVRSLFRDFKLELNNLFDTQLACRFLGVRETSLEAVLQKRFNISLYKKYQMKDWSKRPFTDEMLAYAAMDVVYLLPLSEILIEELKIKQRLAWVTEECRYLSKVRPVPSNSNPLYLKFRGAGRLNPRALAVLEALLQQRRQFAQKKDKPLFKVCSNASLLKIAASMPVSLKHLERIDALSQIQVHMYGNAMVNAVRNALKTPCEDLPIYPHKKMPIPESAVRERIKALKCWRDDRAEALEIEAGLLCNNALISDIAIRNPEHPQDLKTIENMKNWQRDTFGKEILQVLRKCK